MTAPEAAARALSLRLFRATLAAQEAFAAYLGHKLGLYRALADLGPATAGTLAERAGVAPRYAREWLDQQAVCGIVAVGDAGPAGERTYWLPPGHERVLTVSGDPLSLVSTAVLPIGGVAKALPSLVAAYRSGAGVPPAEFGDDWRAGHGGLNRAAYTHQLTGWLRRYTPDLDRRLASSTARVLDVGCGAGWAGIALARAYPDVRVTGVDSDPDMLAQARENAAVAGVADRLGFHAGDAATLGFPEPFDVVCLFDTLHELPRPVEALAACRRSVAGGGAVLVLEARVADGFVAPGDELLRFQYATSVLHCLPAGMVGESAAATGTVMRPATVRSCAERAGFTGIRSYEVDDRLHRLYRLDVPGNGSAVVDPLPRLG